MKYLKINLWTLAVISLTLFASCSDDDDQAAITLDSGVTVANTFESSTITSGVETAIEDLFGQAEGALMATSTVTSAVEFPDYLLGLYDIDIAENRITFNLAAAADDATYGDLFRTLEAGTTDRYYLTFDQDQNVSESSSSDAAVNLRIDADNILVVEIGEGFDFSPGASFTIALN